MRFCWTHSTSGPCFHMSLSAILRLQDGTCTDKCRPVNYPKFQFHGFQMVEQEMVWDAEKVAIATVMVLMGEENHPKSQCYGFEQEMAVDEEKVVMVVATEDRVMVGIAVHWMSC